ncbi:acetylxylan esterase [Cerasicoccus maritimus]|uniref:acetylxylan esterase n=1 Tax=Cerasicoccus maritimus TaxID=490089 RepID=UPI002852C295|nr:acetylxylan esterase [Cerasicoccus maritimus]
MPLKKTLLATLGLTAIYSSLWAAEFKIRTDREDGIYQPGESVIWSIETVNLEEGEAAPKSAHYRILLNGLDEWFSGEIPLDSQGKASISGTKQEPGTLLLKLQSGDVKGNSGAAFSPKELAPSIERPADFDEFWASKKAMADSVALNPVLIPEESTKDGVELWQVTLDNINDTKVRGQLARPEKAEGKLPALLIVQWAGVYPLQKPWACNRAADGWLTLNILAHDLPVYENKEFYAQKSKGPLKGYTAQGNDDRETSYFLRMYLSCYQAVRYLQERDDWDGEILVVVGSSQGGMQTLVTAALCNDVVTAALAKIPAGCDLNGPMAGRAPGWPNWYNAVENKDKTAVRKAAEYYDVVNFSSLIECPTLIGLGLADITCPPSGVFAVANEIEGPVELVSMPSAGHKSTKVNPHKPFYVVESLWLNTLREGGNPLTSQQ